MGLDVSVWKVRKVTDEEIKNITSMEQLNKIDELNAVDMENVKASIADGETGYKDLIPYLTVKTLDNRCLKEKEFCEALGIEDLDDITGRSYSKDTIEYDVRDKNSEDGYRTVSFSREDLYKNYCEIKPVEMGIFEMDDAGYWRKNWDIVHRMEEAYGADITNCGYHKMNPEMIKIYQEEYSNPVTELSDDEALFFSIWF